MDQELFEVKANAIIENGKKAKVTLDSGGKLRGIIKKGSNSEYTIEGKQVSPKNIQNIQEIPN